MVGDPIAACNKIADQTDDPHINFITNGSHWTGGSFDFKVMTLINGRNGVGAEIPNAFGASPNRFGHQRWSQGSDDYTSIFIDLVDNQNQNGLNGGTIVDNVSGYSLANIESTFLKHVYGVSSLGNELRAHKPGGVTDAQINQLLNQFEEIWERKQGHYQLLFCLYAH